MYSGPRTWDPKFIDPGDDDYIVDLRCSVVVDPTVADPHAPPGWSLVVT
jgi:hypothetical protein